MRIDGKYNRNKHFREKHKRKAIELHPYWPCGFWGLSTKSIQEQHREHLERLEAWREVEARAFEKGGHHGFNRAPKWFRKIYERKYRALIKTEMNTNEYEEWNFPPSPRGIDWDWS